MDLGVSADSEFATVLQFVRYIFFKKSITNSDFGLKFLEVLFGFCFEQFCS